MAFQIGVISPYAFDKPEAYILLCKVYFDRYNCVGQVRMKVWEDKSCRDANKDNIGWIIVPCGNNEVVDGSGVTIQLNYFDWVDKPVNWMYSQLKHRKFYFCGNILDFGEAVIVPGE